MSIKLLLVEDEIDLQQNIKDILEIYDFDVTTADNGAIALDLLKKHDFDLVISDIMMPEMDGFELLTEVRNSKNLINLPFIFLTAKVEKDDLRKGMESGAEDYLTKPVHAKDLVNAVNTAIEKQKKREAWLNQKITDVLQEERNVKYHELRTPLFGLMSILELLTGSLESIDQDQLKELLETAYTASKRLNTSLLNLAKYNAVNSYEPNFEMTPSIRNVLECNFSSTSNRFEFIEERDFQTYFDIEALDFIIKELITNATKFAIEDPIYITLKPQSLIIANQQKIISKNQDFKIEAFIQVDRKYHEQQGLGLGLYLCQIYAERNNASLKARISDDLMFIVELNFPDCNN
ncbi:ATP-binding response regulator [Belliella buryatensis]|nr:response regulator [Belliella buryatensis]